MHRLIVLSIIAMFSLSSVAVAQQSTAQSAQPSTSQPTQLDDPANAFAQAPPDDNTLLVDGIMVGWTGLITTLIIQSNNNKPVSP